MIIKNIHMEGRRGHSEQRQYDHFVSPKWTQGLGVFDNSNSINVYYSSVRDSSGQ